MTILHWVRHAPTHAKSFVGWRDLPADLSGTEQIARLNAFLPQEAVVISSDLMRCVRTADALSITRARLPHMAGLREFHFGAWDGMGFSEIAKRDPITSRAYWEAPGDIAPPGGESWNEAAARISHAADHLAIQGHADIIIVAHFGAILTQVQRALNCTAKEVLVHKIDNLAVTQIDMSKPEILTINHLP